MLFRSPNLTDRTTFLLAVGIILVSVADAVAASRPAHAVALGSGGSAEPARGLAWTQTSVQPLLPASPAAIAGPSATVAASMPGNTPTPASLVGLASWYRYRAGEAAAGPRLRALLGASWRGQAVTVGGLRVVLTDWCACYEGTATERIIDLDAGTFAQLADLARGLVQVEVRQTP